ncbi:MAG: very short patch repair endonuclease [Chloroflexota bacterium]
MRANPSRNTGPELRLRSLLHVRGLRYRVNHSVHLGQGRPVLVDIAFTRLSLAVFVDGCFWHACPIHGTVPKANSAYWCPKLQRNAERDRETSCRLEDAGWRVLRLWEHEDLNDAAARVVRAFDYVRSTPSCTRIPESIAQSSHP